MLFCLVEDAGFQRGDQAIAWLIPEEMQSSYLCIGIKINSVYGNELGSDQGTCNSNDSTLYKMRM